MTITWLGKACFCLEKNGYRIILDPYHHMLTGYLPLKTEGHEILVSHESPGHNYRSAVKLLDPLCPSPFRVKAIGGYHDTVHGSQRGPNTIHLITDDDGIRVVHTGDMGEPVYDDVLRGADVVFLESGSYRTMPSEELALWAKEMEAKIIIPMHYHHPGVLSRRVFTLEDLLYYIDPAYPVKYYETSSLEVTKETPRQVAVLKDIK